MNNKPKKTVIIGGGFAGITAANNLKNSNTEVTIIDKANHHLFQPLLYQVATGALSPGDIAAPIRAILGKNSKIRVVLGEVKKIHPRKKHLSLVNGRKIPFDQLVLAPGAQYNYFGNEEWQEHAPGLKTISDALKVRERILQSLEEAEQLQDPQQRQMHLTYVIIGGGPTGVEMAGAIAEIAKRTMRNGFKNVKEEEIRIFLVEAAPNILNGFPEPLGDKGKDMLEELGVKVLRGTPVVKIERDTVHLKVGSIHSSNIIWAAGIKASPLLDSLQVEQDRLGRVFVNGDLSIPGYPDIFVLGDAAHFKDPSGKPLPALASVARQQGIYLGKQLARKEKGNYLPPHFRYIDKGTMATIGTAKAVANIRGLKFSGFFAWVLWSTIHILLLIGFRNRINVFVEWVWNYITRKRGVQLITDRSRCRHCSNNEVQVGRKKSI
ncbi:NADH dehydrogenase [Galbibacter marinus]|uniref:NADH:ubiquinone reductase (non-electrogenic) n=1 Tax=Galbibacter marinus TaxID=555500 RepID=K2Q190_9FLAO|nr:NAD(P)/FAD-dependent oxidoreductase [Galbibacter marinus]EKF54641.1 NADH dehydrogenase [Galbibacter marinus]